MVRVLSGAWRAVAMSIVLGMAAVAATAFGAPGDLDVSGFNAADPVVTDRGKALARPGRSPFLSDNAVSVARQADGKLLVAGDCRGVNVMKLCVTRFNFDGTPDTTFNPDATQGGTQPDLQAGELIIEDTPGQSLGGLVAVQSNGRIIVGGSCDNLTTGYTDFCLVRLLADATLDTSFNVTGATPGVATVAPGNFYNTARGMLLQPDGKVVLVGSCGVTIVDTAMCVSRHNSDGTLDTTFNTTGAKPGTRIDIIGDGNQSSASSVARQSDSKLIITGSCANAGTSDFCVMRLTAVGALDSATFASASSGKLVLPMASDEDSANSVIVQSDGKIVVAGACSTGWVFSSNGVTQYCAARLNSDGTLDTTGFNAAAAPALRGKQFVSFGSDYDGAMSVTAQTDGKLVLAGRCNGDPAMGTGVFCIARLGSDGLLDATFGVGGKAQSAALANQRDLTNASLLQPDGDIVVAGNCFRGAPDAFCVARFKGGPVAPPVCALNVDGNSVVDPATDGVLIVRYLLGYRGVALTSGALGASPTRTGSTLETWIAGLNLDADGDGGGARATSDGLLLLRAMLGLTGSALTQGATNAPSATRNAADIVTWIQQTHGAGCLPTS